MCRLRRRLCFLSMGGSIGSRVVEGEEKKKKKKEREEYVFVVGYLIRDFCHLWPLVGLNVGITKGIKKNRR